MATLTLRLRHLMCGLGGHEYVRHFEHDRLTLQCLFCGYQSSGWSLRADTIYSAPLQVNNPSPPPADDPARPLGLLEA